MEEIIFIHYDDSNFIFKRNFSYFIYEMVKSFLVWFVVLFLE